MSDALLAPPARRALLTKAKRIAVITAGLMATGAVVGAACGAVAMALVAAFDRTGMWSATLGDLAIAAYFGALIGTPGAPVISWVLLRRVPIGLAIAGTAAGTVAGGIYGALTPSSDPLTGAVAGFAAAALILCLASAAAARRARPHASGSEGR